MKKKHGRHELVGVFCHASGHFEIEGLLGRKVVEEMVIDGSLSCSDIIRLKSMGMFRVRNSYLRIPNNSTFVLVRFFDASLSFI